MENPRVAFLTINYETMGSGAGTFVDYLRKAVEADILDVIFISSDIMSIKNRNEVRVKIPKLFFYLPCKWLTYSWFYQKTLLKEHSREEFDVIWNNSVFNSIYPFLKVKNKPYIGMINDFSHVESVYPWSTRNIFGLAGSFKRCLWRIVEKYSTKQTNLIVVNSAFMRLKVSELYNISESKLKILYKGVDLELFRYKDHIIDKTDIINVLFVKHEYRRGGLEELITALSKIAFKFKLTVVGPSKKDHILIKKFATKNNYNGELLIIESVDRANIPKIFSNNDIFCVPSRSEALGVVFMEAISSGIPTIGSNIGGIPEAIDYGKAGWFCNTLDADDLSKVLKEVVNDKDKVRNKAMYGRKFVEKYSHKKMINNINGIIMEALNYE
jgi:glycosyltransferase involved in cell wall biosynthesis